MITSPTTVPLGEAELASPGVLDNSKLEISTLNPQDIKNDINIENIKYCIRSILISIYNYMLICS